MNDERRARMDALLSAALELPAAERQAFLDAECAGDPQLRGAVLELLQDAEGPDSLLQAGAPLRGPLWEELSARLKGPVPSTGEMVGAYRIVRELGRGGMAVVYLAEKWEEVGRGQWEEGSDQAKC